MFDMIRNVMKSLFAGPATRMYPQEKRAPFADARGQVVGIDASVCIFCGLCQRKCPAIAITVDKPTKTWTLNPYKCVVCGVCEEVCPKKCLHLGTVYRPPVFQKENLAITQPPQPSAPEENAAVSNTG